MKEMNLELVGSVIMIHNNQAANPLGSYAKTLKPITSKKKKDELLFGRDRLGVSWNGRAGQGRLRFGQVVCG